jgi:hypothetical protein
MPAAAWARQWSSSSGGSALCACTQLRQSWAPWPAMPSTRAPPSAPPVRQPPGLPIPANGCCPQGFPVYDVHDQHQDQGLPSTEGSPAWSLAGAIFGLGGALAVYAARHRNLMGGRSDAILNSLGQSLALNVAIGLTSPRIDQWCAFSGRSRACFVHALHILLPQGTGLCGPWQHTSRT